MNSSNFRILNGGLETNKLTSDLYEGNDLASAGGVSAKIATENFDSYVSHYYFLKSVEQNTSSSAVLAVDYESSEKLAEIVLKIPVSEPRQLLLKLNILGNELANDMDCAEPVGRKHLMSFAAIKADLISIMAAMA